MAGSEPLAAGLDCHESFWREAEVRGRRPESLLDAPCLLRPSLSLCLECGSRYVCGNRYGHTRRITGQPATSANVFPPQVRGKGNPQEGWPGPRFPMGHAFRIGGLTLFTERLMIRNLFNTSLPIEDHPEDTHTQRAPLGSV